MYMVVMASLGTDMKQLAHNLDRKIYNSERRTHVEIALRHLVLIGDTAHVNKLVVIFAMSYPLNIVGSWGCVLQHPFMLWPSVWRSSETWLTTRRHIRRDNEWDSNTKNVTSLEGDFEQVMVARYLCFVRCSAFV